MERVQYVIDIVDRWEQPIKKFKSDVASIDRMKVTDPFRNMPKSIDRLKANLNRYKQAAATTFRGDHLRKYNMLIGQTEKKIRMLEGASKSASTKTKMLGGAMKMLPAIGVAGGIMLASRAVSRFGKESIMASAAFEKYGVTLRTMLGSQGAARERMTEYADIAKKTPFELRQVVEAGNQLQAIGRYSRSNVTMLGDLAAASGKPIEQVMSAYAKLSTGQKGVSVDMFRDLLISSQDWADATGKGIKNNGELAASTEEMIAALPKILKKKGFFGMMDQQAKTTAGRISNLGDSFDMLKVAVGDSMKPAFDNFLMGTTGILEKMNKWVEIPVPEKIAREKAELNALVGVITDANTGEQVRSDLLRDLQQQYPEFLNGINLETVKNEELRKKLEEVNAEYDKRMTYASFKGLADEKEAELQKLTDEKIRLKMIQVSSGYMKRTEDEITKKFGIESTAALNNKGTQIGKYFYQNLDVEKNRMDKKFANNPDDPKLNEFYKLYSQYKAWQRLDVEKRKRGEAGSLTIYDKIAEKDKEIERVRIEKDLTQGFINKEKNKDLLEQARGLDIKDKSVFEELFGKEDLAKDFDTLRQKTFDTLNMDEWDKLSKYLSGALKYTESPNPNPTGGGLDLNTASATINGGGKMVKQINVTIESLINSNTNMFRDTDSVEDADNFMDKLSAALQLVVNDVNYAAG